MKKLSLKSKLLLGAILMGGMVAGAHTLSKAPSLADPTYNWTSATDPNDKLMGKTIDEAIDHYGCEEGEDPCATGNRVSGTTGDANVTLKFN